MSFITGLVLIVLAGTNLRNELANDNKNSITTYIAFKPVDPTPIFTPTISKVENPFFLIGYNINEVFQARMYSWDSSTQTSTVVDNSFLPVYKAGYVFFMIAGPTLFGTLAVFSLFYMLKSKKRLAELSNYTSKHAKVRQSKHQQREAMHQAAILQERKNQAAAQQTKMANMLKNITESEAARQAMYVGQYDVKYTPPDKQANRFDADISDWIYSNYNSLAEGDVFVFRHEQYQYIKIDDLTINKTKLVQLLAKRIKKNELVSIIIETNHNQY